MMDTIEKIESDIKSLKIQGATNVALAVLDALEKTIVDTPSISPDTLKKIGARLAYARPTEPLAQNALRYIFFNGDISPNIGQYRTFIDAAKLSIPANGEHLLVDGGVYLTLCHSSTTVSLFKQARAGIEFQQRGKYIHGDIFSLCRSSHGKAPDFIGKSGISK